MSTITLKNVPPTVHGLLKSRAKEHGRSLNREIITTLEGALRGKPLDAAAVGKHAREVRETMNVYLTERDLKAVKDAGRR